MKIEITNLSFSYQEALILKNVNLSFEKGKIYGLLGLNGSGKTTLLKLILGLLTEKSGTILINGKNKRDYAEKEIAQMISYVPQGLTVTYDLPVIDFILMGYNPFLKLFEKPNQTHLNQALDLLEQMGLSQLSQKNLCSLSGGELQMVLIARALVQNTDFIIMDEPISNLDLKNERYVLDKIKEISQLFNKAIIISLHDPNLIKHYCDETILLKNGRVIGQGKTEDLINPMNLEAIFGMPFEQLISKSGESYFIGGKQMGEPYFNIINHEIESGRSICEAFIIEIEGTTPRQVGTSMLIKSDGSQFGTIGGGQLEHKVTKEAMRFIETQENGTYEFVSYRDESTKTDWINRVKVFFKVYCPKEQIVLFGAGHVGYNLYQFASLMNFSMIILDEREALLTSEKFPKATKLIKNSIYDAINDHLISPKTYVVIASSNHKSDEEILKRVLSLNYKYVGMLGSKKKVAELFKILKESGITDEQLSTIHAPIGLPIGGETPEEVALSILSEIVSIKNGK